MHGVWQSASPKYPYTLTHFVVLLMDPPPLGSSEGFPRFLEHSEDTMGGFAVYHMSYSKGFVGKTPTAAVRLLPNPVTFAFNTTELSQQVTLFCNPQKTSLI